MAFRTPAISRPEDPRRLSIPQRSCGSRSSRSFTPWVFWQAGCRMEWKRGSDSSRSVDRSHWACFIAVFGLKRRSRRTLFTERCCRQIGDRPCPPSGVRGLEALPLVTNSGHSAPTLSAPHPETAPRHSGPPRADALIAAANGTGVQSRPLQPNDNGLTVLVSWG